MAMLRSLSIVFLLTFLSAASVSQRSANAQPDSPASPDPDAVTKLAGVVKSQGPEGRPVAPGLPTQGPARWAVVQRTYATARAMAVGRRPRTDGAQLAPKDFADLSPPDLSAAIGLATVTEPDDAGWFLSLGRRCVVKPTGGMRRSATLAYESWASAGWMLAVPAGAEPSARVAWSRGGEIPLALPACLSRTVAACPDTGAWLVAGMVRFEKSMGQGLDTSPSVRPRNSCFDPADPKRSLMSPTPSQAAFALLVACIADDSTPLGRQALERFAAEGLPLPDSTRDSARWIAHFSILEEPAPAIDPGADPRDLWDLDPEARNPPRPETLRMALDGCDLGAATLSAWALGEIDDYQSPRGDDLVDIRTVDPSFAIDHHWSKPNPLLDKALYADAPVLLRRAVAKALGRVQARLAEQGLGLKVYDGYRPFSVSRKLWATHPYAAYLARPEYGSRHNRGAAVDCTLIDRNGRDLEMPSPVLTFDKSSDRLREDMTPAARKHLDTLTEAMRAEGFETIKSEWWHYDGPNWENYPVLNVPLAAGAQASAPRPAADAHAELAQAEMPDEALRGPVRRAPERHPFAGAPDTPLPAVETPEAFDRGHVAPEVAMPAPEPVEPAPADKIAAAARSDQPALPMPVLIGIWCGLLAALIAILMIRPGKHS